MFFQILMSLKPISSKRSKNRKGSYTSLRETNFGKRKREFHFPKKRRILLLITTIIILATIFGSDQALKYSTPEHFSPVDPATLIWTSTDPNSNANEYNIRFNTPNSGLGTFNSCSQVGTCFASINNLESANGQTGNGTAIAITKVPIGDLGVATGKVLAINSTWFQRGVDGLGNTISSSTGADFGYFLTINSTVSNSKTYDPYNDPNVVLLDRIKCVTNCTSPWAGSPTVGYQYTIYMLRNFGQGTNETIGKEDFGCTVPPASGSCYMNIQSNFVMSNTVVTNYNLNSLYMNFTGQTLSNPNCSGAALLTSSCTWLLSGSEQFSSIFGNGRNFHPWFDKVIHQQLYLGFYAKENLRTNVFFSVQSSNTRASSLSVFIYNAGIPVNVPPSIDTSGFFGPVINGFLWILTVAVPKGFQVMASVMLQNIQVTWNIIGLFFGWGRVGDNIVTFLNSATSFLLSGGIVIAWMSNIVNRAVDYISAADTWATFWFTGAQTSLGDWTTYASNVVSIAIKVTSWIGGSYVIIMMIFYMILVSENGFRGFAQWVQLNKWLVFSTYNILAQLLQALVGFITFILGRFSVISPGHQAPELPGLDSGSFPEIEFGIGFNAVRRGDPMALVLDALGVVFSLYFVANSRSGFNA